MPTNCSTLPRPQELADAPGAGIAHYRKHPAARGILREQSRAAVT